jgi:hypothetical protein
MADALPLFEALALDLPARLALPLGPALALNLQLAPSRARRDDRDPSHLIESP